MIESVRQHFQTSSQIRDRDLRQRDIVLPDYLTPCRATVIGVGAIGRQVALQLAAIGIPWLQVVDPDWVEPVNLACQGYLQDDLDRPKVQATADLCQQVNHEVEIHTHHERFRRSMKVGDCVFCCVDSIEARRFIWGSVKDEVSFFSDGRMSAEVIRVLTVTKSGFEDYASTLFRTRQAQSGSCTAKSTIFTASIAAGLMLEQFSRWLRRMPVDSDLQINLLASEMIVAVD